MQSQISNLKLPSTAKRDDTAFTCHSMLRFLYSLHVMVWIQVRKLEVDFSPLPNPYTLNAIRY